MDERLKITTLSKYFGGIVALDEVNFSAKAGQIVGIIGPNSSGKTSLLDSINGIQKPDSGDIIFEGRNLKRLSIAQRASLGIGRSFKTPRLFPENSVLDHLWLSQKRNPNHYWQNFLSTRPSNTEDFDSILATLNLQYYKHLAAKHLSLERQKSLELAMTIVSRPSLLLLDEIMAGCSQESQAHFQGALLKLKAEGTTILLVEHHLELLRQVADWILVMNYGRLVAEGKPDEIFTDKILLKVFFTV